MIFRISNFNSENGEIIARLNILVLRMHLLGFSMAKRTALRLESRLIVVVVVNFQPIKLLLTFLSELNARITKSDLRFCNLSQNLDFRTMNWVSLF